MKNRRRRHRVCVFTSTQRLLRLSNYNTLLKTYVVVLLPKEIIVNNYGNEEWRTLVYVTFHKRIWAVGVICAVRNRSRKKYPTDQISCMYVCMFMCVFVCIYFHTLSRISQLIRIQGTFRWVIISIADYKRRLWGILRRGGFLLLRENYYFFFSLWPKE